MKKRRERRYFTKEELLKIHDATDIHSVAREIGVIAETARNAERYLQSYLDGRAFHNATPDAYKQAVAELKSRGLEKSIPQTNGAIQPQGGGTDALKTLEQAFTTLQEAIGEYVAQEVKNRTEQTLKEKEGEIANIKDKYETELQRLQAIIVQAKDSSLMGVIKRKMTSLS